MKNIILLVLLVIVSVPLLAGNNNAESSGDNSTGIIVIVIIAIIHIILTFCVSKLKGPYWACFYFFLVPVALIGLLLFRANNAGRNPNHITVTHRHF